MARRGNRIGYQEYRGRSRGSTVLKVIIAFLVLLLIAGVLFMIFMGEYIEYTDDGVRVHLPWMVSDESQPPELPSDPVTAESGNVGEEEPTAEPSMEPSAEPTAEPPKPLNGIGALEVSANRVMRGEAPDLVAAVGGNALVVEMKSGSGRLAWNSKTEMAASLGVNAASDDMEQAIRQLAAQDDLYLVARLQCFQDSAMARAKIGTLMTKGGNIWYDSLGMCWTTPVNQDVTDYLAALCVELADMGFDEILLDNSGYPNFGEVHVLATDENRPEDLTAPVLAFYEKVSAALEGHGAHLSIYTSEKLLPGEDVSSGITGAALTSYADRVWLDKDVDASQYVGLLTANGMENVSEHLVIRDGNGTAGSSWYK